MHEGRRKFLTGVEGGELTGEMVMSKGADPPQRLEAAADIPHERSSKFDLPPDELSRPPCFLRFKLKWRCIQLPPPPAAPRDLQSPVTELFPANKSGSLVHLSLDS